MKYLSVLFLGVLFISGLSRTSINTPKQIVSDFVISITNLEFENAEKLVTDQTKSIFIIAKSKLQNSPSLSDKMGEIKFLSKEDIMENYGLNNLTELISTNNATVFTSNNNYKIQLEKVSGNWKIVCTPKLLDDILSETQNKSQVISAYKSLQLQYKRREPLIGYILQSSPNTDPVLKRQIKNKLNEIGNIDPGIPNILKYNTEEVELGALLSSYLKKSNIGTTKTGRDLSAQLEGTTNRIQLAKFYFNRAVSNYNKGFGAKIDLLP